jgi:small neutral amino acid transporter SnatA (MarC family)
VIEVFDQQLNDGNRAFVAAFQLLDTSGNVPVVLMICPNMPRRNRTKARMISILILVARGAWLAGSICSRG